MNFTKGTYDFAIVKQKHLELGYRVIPSILTQFSLSTFVGRFIIVRVLKGFKKVSQ